MGLLKNKYTLRVFQMVSTFLVDRDVSGSRRRGSNVAPVAESVNRK